MTFSTRILSSHESFSDFRSFNFGISEPTWYPPWNEHIHSKGTGVGFHSLPTIHCQVLLSIVNVTFREDKKFWTFHLGEIISDIHIYYMDIITIYIYHIYIATVWYGHICPKLCSPSHQIWEQSLILFSQQTQPLKLHLLPIPVPTCCNSASSHFRRASSASSVLGPLPGKKSIRRIRNCGWYNWDNPSSSYVQKQQKTDLKW